MVCHLSLYQWDHLKKQTERCQLKYMFLYPRWLPWCQCFSESQGNKLSAQLSRCYHYFNPIKTFYGLAVCTFLDNRFKNLGFHDSANTDRVSVIMQSVSYMDCIIITFIICPQLCHQLCPNTETTSCSSGGASSQQQKVGYGNKILASQQHRTTGSDTLI